VMWKPPMLKQLRLNCDEASRNQLVVRLTRPYSVISRHFTVRIWIERGLSGRME
jgi:hypothetical protein